MTIRPAKVEDVPAVLPLVARTCAFHEALDPAKYGFEAHPEKRYERWLGARAVDPRSVFLVAENDDGRVVGFIVGTAEGEIPIYRLKEYGFFHDLWVEAEFRRGGIARQLLLRGIDGFRAIGVKQIRLDVAAGNEPARRLFAACGFRPSTIEMLMENL